MEMIYIKNKSNYYNQNYLIENICKDTGYSTDEISKILKSLENSVINTLSKHDCEIKLFPGLTIKSKRTLSEFTSNLGINNKNYILILNAHFSKYFKQKIKNKSDKM